MSTSSLGLPTGSRPDVRRTPSPMDELTPPGSPYLPATSHATGSMSSARAGAGGSNAPRSLALKISRLLSAGLEDAGTRAALETLDDFGLVDVDGTGSGSNGAGAVHTREEGRGAKSKRLRAEVDRRLLEDSMRFLDAFKEVNDKLTDLQEHLANLHGVVDNVQSQLSSANSGTKHLLASAASLRADRAATSDKQAIVTVFLKRFTLSEKEVKALTSRDVPVGRDLFEAIRRTEEIREDCRVLMSGEASEEAKAGMEIMLLTSQHLDSAFAKLHKYTSFAARNYTTRPEVLDNVSPNLRKALQLLKNNRSDLFDDTLSVLSSTRSSAISSMFVEALTRGVDPATAAGRGKDAVAARPIELHAHDPIRYVGDILAWVHQAMASEREFLESLFDMKDSGRFVGAPRPSLPIEAAPSTPALNQSASDEARLRRVLDKNLEGCGRPMRIRIQQTIKSHALISSITTYQIFQLLQFYRVLMTKTMGSQALLVNVLLELSTFAHESFFETLNAQGASLLRSVGPPAMDLKPPTAIRDSLGTLKEIMLVHKQSLLDEGDRSEMDNFEPILEAALDPVTELVARMREMKPNRSEQIIFECNVLAFILSTLDPFSSFTHIRSGRLEQRLASQREELTDLHYNMLLRESGLQPVIAALDSTASDKPLSTVDGANSRNVVEAVRSFDAFLARVDTLSSARLSLLQSPRQASEIHRNALAKVVGAYSRLWDAVNDPNNGYESGAPAGPLLNRSKEEVSTLLNA